MKNFSDPVEAEIRVNPDGPPPAKRRKTERKPRTTEYLNLSGEMGPEDEDRLEQLTNALRKKKKIVVIAGAGISVSSGSTSIHLPMPFYFETCLLTCIFL
jgi:NAD+-dependent protein deacetylase SIR2